MKKISLFVLLFTAISLAQVEVPQLKYYANDLTGTLNDSELSSLNSALKSFDDSTSNQIIFLMMNSIEGNSLESFCNETATKNQIGSKKNNNGVLFFIAKADRKMRIEVGYGLEGALPDALASSILRNEVRPYFKQGDYYAGISAGIESIIKATRGEYKADKKTGNGKPGGFSFIFIIIIFIVISFIGRKGGKGGGGGLLPLLILSSMGGSNRGGWGGSSGGSGGGGFGGFSGGGGSFGGGGASGSW